MCWIYRAIYRNEQIIAYSVGCFEPGGSWLEVESYNDAENAAKRVNYLNGGPLSETFVERVERERRERNDGSR